MMFPPEEERRPKLRGFEVLERLGAGGVGSVYLARSKSGRLVAIKMLGDPRAELDRDQKQALAREASLCARLAHPCIVQVRAFVQDAGYAALVFEYVQGVALARLLRYAASQNLRLPDAAALTIVERVLSALGYAHGHKDESGALVPIVHRDVSPSNVLVDWDGNVKLTDFGMAKMLGRSSDTRHGLVEGTLGCMSPEQARGDSVTERADVYAAALLAWRLLTGISPFAAVRNDETELLRAMRNPRLPSLATLRPDLPTRLLDAVALALVPDPEARRITAEELRAAVAESFVIAQGEVELRALLKSARPKLEAMVAQGGVEQTYSIVDASAGMTMRYEEVALAYDRDPYPDGAPSSAENGAMPRKALDPMRVDVSQELPTIPYVPPPHMRQSLPSLDELTVLSQLALPEIRMPPLRVPTPVIVHPENSAASAPEPKTSSLPPSGSVRPRPARWVVTTLAALVTLAGAAVGVGLAWLLMR